MTALSKPKFYIFVILFFLSLNHLNAAPAETAKVKKVKFSWGKIEWAIDYEIQIKNTRGELVLKKNVSDNSIEFMLSPGKYKLRIGAKNKFEKILWSGWQDTEIKVRKPKKKFMFDFGVKFSLGMPYYHFLDIWETTFENSFMGVSGKIAFNIGDFVLFRPSDTIKYTGLLRFIGFELEGGYTFFKGKNSSNKYKIDKNEMTVGGNIFFTTDFDIINFIIRAGGGAAYSNFTYHVSEINNGNDIKAASNDPYYKFGCSIEINFYKYYFMEAGADYFVINYINNNYKALRYYFQIGVML